MATISSARFYLAGLQDFFKTSMGWITGTGSYKMFLLDDTYTPNQDTHLTYAGINGDELSGGGYTAGGVALTGLAVYSDSYPSPGGTIVLLADDVVFPSLTSSIIRHAAIYNTATGCLICYFQWNGNITASSQDFTVAFPDLVIDGYTYTGVVGTISLSTTSPT